MILLDSFSEEDATVMLQAMCKVLKFDPEQGLYSKGRLKEISERQTAEAAERGMSIFELRHRHAYYEKHKEHLNKQRTLYRQKKKAEAAATAV